VNDVGVGAIGRKEREGLRICLGSGGEVSAVVYVESGSSDGSETMARRLGAKVVALAFPHSDLAPSKEWPCSNL